MHTNIQNPVSYGWRDFLRSLVRSTVEYLLFRELDRLLMSGIVSCGLGFLPAGALVGYSAIFHYATGPDTYVHASDGGNVFQAIP